MPPAPNTNRFPAKRIAVTVPPGDWFHGIPRAMFDLYRGALVELGFEIFDVPVDAFVVPDATRIASVLADLKAFRPEIAFGLPKGSYALICRLPPRRDGWRANLFADVLDIPTICLWDHAPIELADQLLAHPADPAESVTGAQEVLRQALAHPRLIHWSPDTGQTQVMAELGFLLPDQVIQESLPSLPGFAPQESGVDSGAPSVGFIGHFYQAPFTYPHVGLRALAEEVIRAWLAESGRPLWQVLADHLAGMDPDLRKWFALHRDQTYFWHFAHRLIVHQAQTAVRLDVLGSAGVPVACYGNLKIDMPGVPGNLEPVPGETPFGPQLAAMFTRHAISVDVFNPGSIHGYSHKPMMAFASGGFMLVNRRRDFIQAFGEAGEAVSYHDDLNAKLDAKIDRFLTNPKYLREVGGAIRETISARFQLKDVLTRVLDAAFLCPQGTGRRMDPGGRTIVAKNVLKKIGCRREWSGASVEHRDGTALIVATQQWGYAAEIKIPGALKKMREPHLRLSLLVETGTVGIAALAALQDKTEVLLSEQLVSAGAGPITVTVELPHTGVSAVIVRNTAGIVSRARVLEASLCDRVTRPA